MSRPPGPLMDRLLSLQVFAFEGKNTTLSVRTFSLLACIVSPAVIRTVCKCGS